MLEAINYNYVFFIPDRSYLRITSQDFTTLPLDVSIFLNIMYKLNLLIFLYIIMLIESIHLLWCRYARVIWLLQPNSKTVVITGLHKHFLVFSSYLTYAPKQVKIPLDQSIWTWALWTSYKSMTWVLEVHMSTENIVYKQSKCVSTVDKSNV